MSDAKNKLMKEYLSQDAIDKIARYIVEIWPEFNVDGFKTNAFEGIEQLELKQRIGHIILILHRYLPSDFEATVDIFIGLAKIWKKEDELNSFESFAIWPIIDYIGEYGLNHPKKSLDALEILTQHFSAEFAIRPFINQHFDLTFARMIKWTGDDNPDIRRLASEGIRPRLPWGLQLKQYIVDPSKVIEILTLLKDDDAEYVRRSVANNLNDISKDHAQLVVDICKDWLTKSSKAKYANQMWIAKRATRGLVKQGFAPVFGLLGYSEQLEIDFSGLKILNPTVNMGDYLEFEFELYAHKHENFVLDFVIHFMKSNGKLAPKVFKLKNLKMIAGDKITIAKSQIFKPISTRKYYAGEHKLEILLNGNSYGTLDFILKI